MMNIPNLIFALVMGFLMSASITLATTLVRIGLTEDLLWVWLEVWAVAYPVAIICILFYRPFASRMTVKLLDSLCLSQH